MAGVAVEVKDGAVDKESPQRRHLASTSGVRRVSSRNLKTRMVTRRRLCVLNDSGLGAATGVTVSTAAAIEKGVGRHHED